MYSHRKAALVGGAGGPGMLDVYRVGPVRTATRGWPWWLLSRVSGLKGMETRFGLVSGPLRGSDARRWSGKPPHHGAGRVVSSAMDLTQTLPPDALEGNCPV